MITRTVIHVDYCLSTKPSRAHDPFLESRALCKFKHESTGHRALWVWNVVSIGLDWICLTTTHVLQDILAVLTWVDFIVTKRKKKVSPVSAKNFFSIGSFEQCKKWKVGMVWQSQSTHSRAHCSPGARLCEQWVHGCVNNWCTAVWTMGHGCVQVPGCVEGHPWQGKCLVLSHQYWKWPWFN